jgi:ATP-dependent DNA helicase RecQ
VLGCTATANDRVVTDVAAQLGAEMTTFRGRLRRDGLALHAIPLDRQAERLAWLASEIPELDGSGIVYCLTVRDVQHVAEFLRSQGIAAVGYWGALDDQARLEAERRLLSNELKVLVATTALGMGYDKPDLSFVVHFQAPGSPVAYYQQVGRAGRALEQSHGILLRGLEDEQIQDYFIERAFAAEHLVRDVLHMFDAASGPLSLIDVQQRLNIGWATLELVVKQLDVDGALRRVGGQVFERTQQPYEYPSARIDAVTEARRAEQQSMRDYFESTECRMRYLANLLDDDDRQPCGICDNCTGKTRARQLPVGLIAEAEQFLLQRPIEIASKKQRLDATTGSRRKIADELRLEEGRALSVWGDAGWGRLVRDARLRDGTLDDDLIDAIVALVQRWAPTPTPAWVASVPSLRRPELVRSAARRVAAALGLEHVDALVKADERPAQVTQQNSAHQQRNVEGSFTVAAGVAVPPSPVLLIDDLVDSGWTLTEVGGVLRRAGAGPVFPLTFASSTGRG